MPSRLLLPLFAASALFMACGGGSTDAPPPTAVQVTPQSPALTAIGDAVQLTAQAVDASGKAKAGASFTWSVQESSIASVSAQALVTAVGPGTATVRATLAGGTLSGTTTVVVSQTVTTLQLANKPDSLLVGSTVTLTASAKDRNGNAVAGPSLTWTSSDNAVATVSASGVVTGLTHGSATIRATSGSASAEGTIAVRRPILLVSRDTVLAGTVQVRSLTIPEGVTVTASGPLALSVQERALIRGSILANCRSISITAGGAVVVSGRINNACADSTSSTVGDVTIAGTDTVAVENASVVTSGTLYITNNTSLTEGQFPPFLPIDTSAAARLVQQAREVRRITRFANAGADGECRLQGNFIAPFVPESGSLANGNPGSPTVVRCSGRIVLASAIIQARGGWYGLRATVQSASLAIARGGDGGAGGSVRIEAMGDVVITGATSITSGAGGMGGRADATGAFGGGDAQAGASAEAYGGHGGAGGTVRIVALGGTVTGAASILFERGGSGGDAFAVGATGRAASASGPAQDGGYATAVGGAGGSGPTTGKGGSAESYAGIGGDGSSQFPAAGAGGANSATGGRGGRAVAAQGFVALAEGGNGGSATVSDGGGGNGYGTCFPAFAVGGKGGRGGSASGRGGTGGTGFRAGDDGLIFWTVVGNGGDGGSGLVPGGRGGAGTNSTTGARGETINPVFQPGVSGATCAPPSSVAISVAPTTIANTHTIGTSSCPQAFGTAVLTNTGTVAVSWSGSPPSGLSIAPSYGSLTAGQSATVQVNFTCAVPSSFTGLINFTATPLSGSGSASAQLTVQVTVH